jgi:diaminopimelate decarboxylase
MDKKTFKKMNYLPENLKFEEGVAFINDFSLLDISSEHGTPLYVYDWENIKKNISEFTTSFGNETLYRYAAKAFICKKLVTLLDENNWGVDVVSGGEMATVLSAVGTLENTLFNGTYKTKEEIDYFISNNGGHISIDNLNEISLLQDIASKNNRKQPVILRINLDLGAETHPMVLTSGYDQQFGLSIDTAENALKEVYNADSLLFSGVHVHIFDAGGGFFSPYEGDEDGQGLEVYADSIKSGIEENWDADYKIMIEPGRAVVNNSGLILYTAGAIKEDRGEKPYILVDGGMSDNPRPALYGSEHKLFNISENKNEKETIFAVSGRHCESGDLLVKEAHLPDDTKPGDILMSTSTGAYTYAMASNYNRVPKAKVVGVSNKEVFELVKRQSYEDTVSDDI